MKRNDTLVLATNDSNKIESLTWIVDPYFKNVVVQFHDSFEPHDYEKSFEDNAANIAIESSKKSKCFAVAVDGGLHIPSADLECELGCLKKNSKNKQLIIDKLSKLKNNDIKAIRKEAIAIAYNGNLLYSTEVEGVDGILCNDCIEGNCIHFAHDVECDPNEIERKNDKLIWHRLKGMFDWFMAQR